MVGVQPWAVIGVMSPKPTVVKVVKPKYKAVKKSFQGRTIALPRFF